jgi:hypothetical protein
MEEVKKPNALLKCARGIAKMCAIAVALAAGPAIGYAVLVSFCDKANELRNQTLEGFENSDDYAQFAELKQSESEAAKAKFNEGALTDVQLAATLQQISSRPYELQYVYNNSPEYAATLKKSDAYGVAGICFCYVLTFGGVATAAGAAFLATEDDFKAHNEAIAAIDSGDDKRKDDQEKVKDEGMEK